MNTDKPTTTASAPETRTLKLKTFDKHQGWQTLETFADFETASKRAQAILASNPLWTVNNLRIVDERTIPAEKPTVAQKLNDLATELHIQRDAYKAHADKLAEALRAWEYAGNEGGISMADWFEVARKKTREALAAYEELR